MDMKKISQAAQALKKSGNAVAVTGAGVSTEAGVPDFRSPGGLYEKMGGEDKVIPLINIDAFIDNVAGFYDFHWKRFDYEPPVPCEAHTVLAEMEEKRLLKGIVTQNTDGLHQKAGSKNIIPIHGNADRYVCISCGKTHVQEYARTFIPGVPECDECDGLLKPNIVLYGENVSRYNDAAAMIMNADCLLVIGTSLTVYPIAGLVHEYSLTGRSLIMINKGATRLDGAAELKIEVGETDTLGEILREIYRRGV